MECLGWFCWQKSTKKTRFCKGPRISIVIDSENGIVWLEISSRRFASNHWSFGYGQLIQQSSKHQWHYVILNTVEHQTKASWAPRNNRSSQKIQFPAWIVTKAVLTQYVFHIQICKRKQVGSNLQYLLSFVTRIVSILLFQSERSRSMLKRFGCPRLLWDWGGPWEILWVDLVRGQPWVRWIFCWWKFREIEKK